MERPKTPETASRAAKKLRVVAFRCGSVLLTLRVACSVLAWEALDCDVAESYGVQFKHGLSRAPSSALLAEGSALMVSRGVRLS
jgi:hypothetical protein